MKGTFAVKAILPVKEHVKARERDPVKARKRESDFWREREIRGEIETDPAGENDSWVIMNLNTTWQ